MHLGVRDVLNGVRRAGVFSDGGRVVVHLAGVGIKLDVLEHRAKLDRTKDLGLGHGREVDALYKVCQRCKGKAISRTYLCVATALDVEDALVGPTVLVIADELATRIGRQGGLASAGQTEEESNITVRTLIT